MVAMHPGRTYQKMRRLPPEIIDVLPIVDKELPGNIGLPGRGPQVDGTEVKVLKVPEGALLEF